MTEDNPAKALSPELAAFVLRHFTSVRQLEILLWLFTHREREWSSEALARALCCDASATLRWLDGFRAGGLVTTSDAANGLHRYAPADARTDAMVLSLDREYKVRPLKIIDVIANQRTMKMMDFMNAFKLRSEDDDDDG